MISPLISPHLSNESSFFPFPKDFEWMSVAKKHTVAWTLESNAALYAKWPPRHIPVAPNLPLQVGKLNKYSIVKLVSSSYDFNSFFNLVLVTNIGTFNIVSQWLRANKIMITGWACNNKALASNILGESRNRSSNLIYFTVYEDPWEFHFWIIRNFRMLNVNTHSCTICGFHIMKGFFD